MESKKEEENVHNKFVLQVSAFATFHLFVLPALRKHCGYSEHKLSLPVIHVEVRLRSSQWKIHFHKTNLA